MLRIKAWAEMESSGKDEKFQAGCRTGEVLTWSTKGRKWEERRPGASRLFQDSITNNASISIVEQKSL